MRCAPVVVLSFLGSQLLPAQAVRGRVLSAGERATPGAVVTLLDARGVGLARALTDEEGRFSFRPPEAGEYRVEVQHTAHAASASEVFRVATGETAEVMIAPGARIALPARYQGESGCLGGDSASAGHAVWREVRKALLATQLTRLTRAYTMDVETFVRRQPPDRSQPPTVDRNEVWRSALRALSSVPPAQLVTTGYLTRGAAGDRYHAPDDAALLSEGFAATHCLRLLPYDERSAQLRLGFTPVAGRSQPDIRGAITVDRASLELQRVDFVYVNLRAAEQQPPADHAGEIVFQRLPEGSWIMGYWSLTLPFVESYVRQQAVPATTNRRGVSAPARPATVLTGVGRLTSGGGVTRVHFGDTVVWQTTETPMPREPVKLPP